VRLWTKDKERKVFFDNIAAEHNFDPLVPANWYNLSYASLEKHKVRREEEGEG
jgi:hypothetical protein